MLYCWLGKKNQNMESEDQNNSLGTKLPNCALTDIEKKKFNYVKGTNTYSLKSLVKTSPWH